jgi:phosphatidylglycerol---prolipoprotein diacylglyceryl transferase
VLDTFDIFGIPFPAYFTLLMGGYVVVVWLAHRDAPRLGVDGNDLLDLAMVLIVAGIIGARLLHVTADGFLMDYVHLCTEPFAVKGEVLPKGKKCVDDASCEPLARRGYETCDPATGVCHQGRDCLRALKFWYGGLTYYGGLGLAIPVGLWFIRRRRMPFWRVADMGGYGIPLGLVFGRLGCLLAGCCFGSPCPADRGIVFPPGSPAWEHHLEEGLIPRTALESLPTWPAQVWEGAACLLIFAYLYLWRRHRQRFDGQLFFVYCMLYAVARFAVEFWRDDARGGVLGLSTSQWLGFPLFAFGAFMYWRAARRPALPPPTP